MEQDPGLIAEARRQQHRQHLALARRTRRRARIDICLVAVATGLAALTGNGTHESLMGASLALSLGILFYVIRRDRDLTALAGQERWRDEALEGRGIPIEAWRSGARGRPAGSRDGS